MIYLDVISLVLELLSVLYVKCVKYNQFFSILRNWFMINIGYTLFNETIPKWFDIISTFLISHTPPTFFYCLRSGLDTWRHIANIRMVLTWFPMINPWVMPWPILTEPVDFILRPLCWRLPKMYYVDLSTWIVFYVLDLLIDITEHLSRLSDNFHGYGLN
jgi:hypothetical protein